MAGSFVGHMAAEMPQPTFVAAEHHDRPSRQKLSCTSCHTRKVKCDRVKPCQACCARGRPYDCRYTNEEIRQPISQAQEIRRLRKLVHQLTRGKGEAQDLMEGCVKTEDEEFADSPGDPESLGDRQHLHGASTKSKQWKPKAPESRDSLFFGSPGMASVVDDFAKTSVGHRASSITYAIPRAVDIYAYPDAPLYPFPTLWAAHGYGDGMSQLLQCLPAEQDIFNYLQNYQNRARVYSFPHMPDDTTVDEIHRFLTGLQENAQQHPDMLALVFSTLALGVQEGAFDRSGSKWDQKTNEKDSYQGDLFIAASMQALRLASFTNRPTLLVIQTLIMICPYLINAGKFLDAWALFHLLVGLAHSIGLHRNPKLLHPSPPEEVCGLRQTLWWWMLHMDQQMAATLGRPLCISGIGDCPPYEPLTADATTLRVGTYINQYTILARQILSSSSLDTSKIDEFTDKLLDLRDTLPDLVSFSESWLDPSTPIPSWPFDAVATLFHCKTDNMLILLNRQRTAPQTPASEVPNATFHAQRAAADRSLRGRDRVLRSCRSILVAFDFLYRRVPAALICWQLGQQAFNATMILLLSMLETYDDRDLALISRAYDIFRFMHHKGINKLAHLAVEKIKGLCDAPQFDDQRQRLDSSPNGVLRREPVMGHTGMILLEDPGLQGHVSENYQPMNVKTACSNLQLNEVPMGRWHEDDRRQPDKFAEMPKPEPVSPDIHDFSMSVDVPSHPVSREQSSIYDDTVGSNGAIIPHHGGIWNLPPVSSSMPTRIPKRPLPQPQVQQQHQQYFHWGSTNIHFEE